MFTIDGGGGGMMDAICLNCWIIEKKDKHISKEGS